MKKSCSLLFSLGFCALTNSLWSNPASAQISADGTTNTTVNPDGSGNFTIEQGDRAGNNLFHSFGNFSVPTNGSAFFNNASDISNILSRVTGGNISSIDGLIRANGSANLFLINPAGILFGNNARLDIGGSFLGTTADSILFEDGEFSATDFDNPPLLTINAPIGLGFRDNPNQIVNSSFVQNDAEEFVGLEVAPGKNLSLIGGDISFESGEATARGGKVELGGLSDAGTITIEPNGSLTFPQGVARSNVSFSNDADVDVRSEGGGSISVNANNIEILGGEFGSSSLSAGILSSSTSPDAQAGDINLNATGVINISQGSNIFNQVATGGIGNSGNIIINTTDLSLLDGAQITAGVFGTGNAGKVTVNALGDTTFQGVNPNSGFSTGIINNVASDGIGNAGDIQVNTANLNLIDGGSITSNVFGEGNAGSITINASEAVSISGSTVFDENSTRFSRVNSITGTDVLGNAGSIEIDANSLTISDGGVLSTSTDGRGNAGDITLNIDGAVNLTNDGDIFSNVDSNAITEEGTRSTVAINADSLSIADGESSITVSTFGQGNAGNIALNISNTTELITSDIFSQVAATGVGEGGNITLNTNNLSLSDGAQITAGVFGTGDAGNVTIDASNTITFQGVDPDSGNPSGILSNVTEGGAGDAGDTVVTTANLNLIDGGRITSNVFGEGNAGSITINASDAVNISGTTVVDENTTRFSRVNSSTGTNVLGNAGSIEIDANSLTISDGGVLSTNTDGQGNAGNITLNINGAVNLTNNADIFSQVDSNAITDEGTRSTVTINADSLSIADGESSISVSTLGQGNAGNITLNISNTTELTTGDIFSQVGATGVGEGGNITLNTNNLSLSDGAQITAGVSGTGDAGTVTVNALGDITFQGVDPDSGNPSGILSNVAASGAGNAGDTIVTTANLNLIDGGSITSNISGRGNAGKITINASEGVNITGATVFNENTTRVSQISSRTFADVEGNAGSIEVSADSLILSDGSFLNSSINGQGNAGNINLDISNTTELTTSNIFSQVSGMGVGEGGNITLNTSNLSLSDGAQITAGVFGTGDAGSVTVNALGDITFQGVNPNSGNPSGILSNVTEGGAGDAGDTVVTTANLNLIDGGRITSDVFGEGNAGSITINASEGVNITGATVFNENTTRVSQISSRTFADVEGNAGSIEVSADSLILSDGSFLNSSINGQGNAGNINLDISNTTELTTSNIFSQVSGMGVGEGGNITLNTSNLSLIDGAQITAGVFGTGDAGSVTVNALGDITFQGVNPNSGNSSGILSNVTEGGAGDAGDTVVTTANLNLIDGGRITSDVFGEGNAGSITINASDAINISGTTVVDENTTRFSRVNSSIGTDVLGNAGSIEIDANSLTISDGGVLSTNTDGQGNAGNITLNINGAVNLTNNGDIFSEVDSNAIADEGTRSTVAINADSLSIADGESSISTSTFGEGNAGNIALNISNTTELTTGNIFSQVTATGVGEGGNITLNTNNLSLSDGAQITAGVFGTGDAGNVTVNAAGNITFQGVDPDSGNPSGILSNVTASGTGDAGDTVVTTANLNLIDGGSITSDVFGEGNAGSITINASDAVNISGSTVVDETTTFSQVSSRTGVDVLGNAGSIEIKANSLTLANRAELDSSTSGQGNAGNVVLDINDTVEIVGGNIFSTVEPGGKGNGGIISVQAQSFSLTEGGNLQTLVRAAQEGLAGGEGNAGNVILKVDTVDISGRNSAGISSQITSQSGSGTEGNAGNIEINADSLTLSDGGLIESSTLGRGNGGTITITVEDLTLDNQGQILAETTFPQEEGTPPSDINLFIDDTLILKNNSTISAEAANSADGGNITINAEDGFVVAFPSEGTGSDIRANAAEQGSGGEINISAQQIFGLSEARGTSGLENDSNDIDASSEDGTLDGDVTINASDINPVQGAAKLPTSIVKPDQSVAQACSNNRDAGVASNFVIKGKGGIPPLITAPLNSEMITINGEIVTNSTEGYAIPTSIGDITPARGVIKTPDGKIILTATPVSGSASRMAHGSLNCG